MTTTVSGTTGVNLIQDGTIVAADFAASTGSGSVVLATSPTITTPTIATPTITNATITYASTANPAFSAYRSTNQVVSFNAWTKIALNGEDFDTNNNFDPTTNYRFTPTVAGYYQFNGVVAVQSSSTLTRVILALWKNNSQALRGSDLPFSAGTSVVFTSVPGLIYMNGTTDYMELYTYVSGSGTPTLLANSGEYPTLSGFLARSA
jgi:hypothetical protein